MIWPLQVRYAHIFICIAHRESSTEWTCMVIQNVSCLNPKARALEISSTDIKWQRMSSKHMEINIVFTLKSQHVVSMIFSKHWKHKYAKQNMSYTTENGLPQYLLYPRLTWNVTQEWNVSGCVSMHACICVYSIKMSLSRLSLLYLKSESEVETTNFQIKIMIWNTVHSKLSNKSTKLWETPCTNPVADMTCWV